MSALVLYLTKPVDEFATLTTADQEALATLLRRVLRRVAGECAR